MVTRYSGMGSNWTMPREDGDYVKYDDYAAIEAKVLAIHSHLERAVASQFNSKGYVKMALRIIEEEFSK